MAASLLLEQPAEVVAEHTEPSGVIRPVPVLHVINGEHYAGAERVQDLLALELGRFGFQVGFACLKPGQFPEMRQARDAILHELPMANGVRATTDISVGVR